MPAYVTRHLGNNALCLTEYIPTEGWLRTTWQGYISPADAEQGANGALEAMYQHPSPYLLNDNSQILGPWFDSVDWLQQVWVPLAARLGLRYVAHVLQPHTESDLGRILTSNPFGDGLELQLFTTVEEAAAWLHECQRRNTRSAGTRLSSAA